MVLKKTWKMMLRTVQNLRYADVSIILKHRKIPADDKQQAKDL